ncbi:MAG: ATP-binding protein [Acutalibacteraceae bacterium]
MNKRAWKLTIAFSLMIFIILLITMFTSFWIVALLYRSGLLVGTHKSIPYILYAITSIILGSIFTKLFGSRPIHMFEHFSEATKEITKGNFNIQIDEKVPTKEFRTLIHNFNIMANELSRTEIMRKDFVENVSHEFKTPLSAIEGYTMLLQKDGLTDSERKEYAEKILLNSKRLSKLTGNILLLSRLDNQETEIIKKPYFLNEQIRKTVIMLENKWSSKNINLDIELDEVKISANEELMASVWQNLLDNSIKFTDKNGNIGIQLYRQGKYVCVSISDDGIGMTEEETSRVYEKFYQADNSRSTKGNGLGLALVKRIIDLHHGEINVQSEKNKGTTVTITLQLQE